MILKALTLENFKGIREPVRIEFAPLTLLFGPNNAGKSTIVQALMYAREVFERNNCNAGTTELGGSIVDLGGFENIIYGRDLNRVIRMRFDLDLSEKALPDYSGWIEQNELEMRIWDLGGGEEGFDVASSEKVISRLNQVWVEIQVSWDSERGAHVSEYSVGHGTSSYARVFLSEKQEGGPSRALLSSFNYGTYPFGSTYEGRQGLASSLVPDARKFIKEWLLTHGLDGFQKGAVVAMDGEVVDPGDDRVPWERFNQLVGDAVAGRGEWGDSSVHPETGKENIFYLSRQLWLKLSELLQKRKRNTPEEELSREDEDVESWLLDLLQILVKGEYIPVGSKHPLRLSVLGTALPEWGRKLDFDPMIWEEYEDEPDSTWKTDLVFGREYLKDLLTTIVVGPGQRLKEALEKSVYLSAFREVPQRSFSAANSPDSRRWSSGLAAWDRLLQEGKPFADKVNKWLNGEKRFNSGYWIEAERFKELDIDGELFHALVSKDCPPNLESLRDRIKQLQDGRRLRIVDSTGGRYSPQDLGVGISQVVPVIVTALHSESRVVAIEEPESNVHPAFQVVLADLFITQAKAKPDVLFLVETHSEHLMLRVMRRMRETYQGKQQGELAIGPSDVSVRFVERDGGRTLVRPMPLNEAGELVKAWPDGFFEEGLREQFGDD